MRLHPDDTIAALATAPGAAARGIIRISGPRTREILMGWFLPDRTAELLSVHSSCANVTDRLSSGPATRQAGSLQLNGLWQPVSVDLYFWPGPRSYTGETLAELHLVGSPPLLEAVLAAVYDRGTRPAEPGEFTLRAFLSGRVDLTQAEAVLGVIDAASDVELKNALKQLAGGLAHGLADLRSDLIDLLADLEAGLDFADEAIEFVAHDELVDRLLRACSELEPLLNQVCDRGRTQPRWKVVLTGKPNAGKSTLFNALVSRTAALVSSEPGTTRDYLSAELELEGIPILLVDTAGVDSTIEGIAGAAQMRRQGQVEEADLVVWCHAADDVDRSAISAQDAMLLVQTKSELKGNYPVTRSTRGELEVSVHQQVNLERLRGAIAERLTQSSSSGRQLLGTTAARTHESLRGAVAALDRALAIARREIEQELLAIEIRDALGELGKITGAVYTDDILDRIFSKFCIGK